MTTTHAESETCETCRQAEAHRHPCERSRRMCGHHCNHSWTHDACCWCGEEWSDDEYDDDDEREANMTDESEDTKRVTPPMVANQELVRHAERLLEEVRSGAIKSLCTVASDGTGAIQSWAVVVSRDGEVHSMLGGLDELHAQMMGELFRQRAIAAAQTRRIYVPGS